MWGQIVILGKSIYSTWQGAFPKYACGIYDNKLVVSRGMNNTHSILRICNPTKVVFVDVTDSRL